MNQPAASYINCIDEESTRPDGSPIGLLDNESHLQRLYETSPKNQYLFELVRNSIQSFRPEHQNKRIDIDCVWDFETPVGAPASYRPPSRYKFKISDNGSGMSASELPLLVGNIAASGKIIKSTGSFGQGLKPSCFPWNKLGTIVMSWQHGVGHAIKIIHVPKRGFIFHRWNMFGENAFEHDEIIPLDDYCPYKPEWIEDHGTVIILMGNSPDEHTYFGPGGQGNVFGNLKALNYRFFTPPEDIRINVRVFDSVGSDPARWPKVPKAPHAVMRQMKGANHYLESVSSSTDIVQLEGAKLYWYRKGKEPGKGKKYAHGAGIHNYAPESGLVAVLYQGELHEIADKRTSVYRHQQFGFHSHKLAQEVSLIIEPQAFDPATGLGVHPSDMRDRLLWGSDGTEMPYNQWGEQFASQMPSELRELVDSGSETNPESLKKAMAAWQTRLNEMLKVGKLERGGELQGAHAMPGMAPRRHHQVRTVVNDPPHPHGGTGGRDGKGYVEVGENGRHLTQVQPRTDEIIVHWFHESNDMTGLIPANVADRVVFHGEAGCYGGQQLSMNLDHFSYVDEVKYWRARVIPAQSKFATEVVQEIISSEVLSRVILVRTMKRRSSSGWTDRELEQLTSQAAITVYATSPTIRQLIRDKLHDRNAKFLRSSDE